MTKWTAAKLVVAGLWMALGCGGSGGQPSAPSTRISVPAQGAEQPLEVATEVPSAPAGQQPTSAELPIDDDDQVWGKADALVTVVEFADLQCPFSARVQATLAQLTQRYGSDKLRLVYKHNPLPFHQQAEEAARFAQATRLAAGSDLSARFVAIAFSRQAALGRDAYSSWVREIGLDPARIAALADSEDVRARVRNDMALAKAAGASGTPAFYVNGVKVSGAQPLERFVEVIDGELRKAEELLQGGRARSAVYAAMVRENWQKPPPPGAVSNAQEAPDLDTWKMPSAGAPARGPADALVTVVAFYSYQCPFSKRVQATLEQLLQRYPSDVAWWCGTIRCRSTCAALLRPISPSRPERSAATPRSSRRSGASSRQRRISATKSCSLSPASSGSMSGA